MIAVEFTQTAEDDYLDILDNVSRNSIDEAIAIDAKLTALINNLKKYKHFCPLSLRFPRFRRCVITNSISLVYELSNQSITITPIFYNRSNNPFTS